MKTFIIITALLCGLVAPALAADTPESVAKRVTNLEKATLVMQEDIANTKLAVEDTQDKTQNALDAHTKALNDLTAQLAQLQKALAAEVTARGQSDKLIAELQTELVNQKLKTNQLEEALAKEKTERETAVAQLNKAIAENTKKDKKDRTITYGMGALLGILALTTH